VFQNVTYASPEEAISAPRGSFVLRTCGNCGFSHNGDFVQDLVVYDDRYDNHVESGVFAAYYTDLSRLLCERLDLSTGVIYDVGCGDGEFLRVLCAAAPDVVGIGIDPSCTPTTKGNVSLIQDTFNSSSIESDAQLVLLRHVLEHLEDPLDFLKTLRQAMSNGLLFVEVPDFEWILANRAFWDLSYEHCNYFTPQALQFALESADFEIIEQKRSFGNQYQWALCKPTDFPSAPKGNGKVAVAAVGAYAAAEVERIANVRELAEEANGLVLWGMSSKGVILTALLPEGLVIGGIDMNLAKQGRFAAATGVQIHSPEWLIDRTGSTVAIMNSNYSEEIGHLLTQIGAEVELVSIESINGASRA
jgi:SAM-dependent methyltransferase